MLDAFVFLFYAMVIAALALGVLLIGIALLAEE